ncbi:MAG: phosphatase PAP2 family protein [Alphaproteobacteria bacterium]
MRPAIRLLPGLVADAVATAAVRGVAGTVLAWRRAAAWWQAEIGRHVAPAVWAALALTVVAILAIDRPVAEAVRQIDPDLRAVLEVVTQLGDSAGYIVGGIVLALVLWVVERARPDLGARWRLALWSRRSAYFAACVVVSGLASILLKIVFGRPRPRMWFGEELFAFHPFTIDTSSDFASIPSGHSTTIWSVAVALLVLFGVRRVGWAVVPVALAVSATRVLLTDHFVGDVIAGAALGGLTAVLLAPPFRVGRGRN